MQVSLTTMICVYMFGNKSMRDDKDLTSNNPDLQNSPYILLTRFICAIILHLQIEPKICQSINLMRFSFNRTANAARKFPQFTVAMATEIINMVVICIETDPSNIVQNLLAFGVICLIDDFYV
jgi:hypothetical protein